MSKINVKPQTSTQAAQAAPAPSGTGAASVAATVVQSTPATEVGTPPQPDVHHGHGGLYTVQQGQRVLVERTAPVGALNQSN